MFSKKYFLGGVIVGLVLVGAFFKSLPDGKLHIVFCSVGQGDAAYIRTPSNQDMLIDGGPDDSVLSCLGRHMPFFDRTIDVVMLSHPQKDHLQGLLSVIQRYRVETFVIGGEQNSTEGYKEFISLLKKNQISTKTLFSGDSLRIGKVDFDILWPSRTWFATKTQSRFAFERSSDEAVLGMISDEDINSFSYFLNIRYGNFSTLFTGDGDSKIQPEIMHEISIPHADILKYPHHGSKTGILSSFLDLVRPTLAVISVGKNSFGHPSKEALQLLMSRQVEYARTDQRGDIEVVSDGKGYQVKSQK